MYQLYPSFFLSFQEKFIFAALSVSNLRINHLSDALGQTQTY